MNFFWVIAAAQAAFTAYCVLTGRIRARGHTYADREVGPRWFWFAITLLTFSVGVVIYEALNPPY